MKALGLPLRSIPAVLIPLAVFATSVREARAEAITLSIGSSEGSAESRVRVPVLVEGADQLGPVQLVLRYDPTVLSAGEAKRGALARSGMIYQETPEPGVLRVAMTTDEPITGDGELLAVEFRVVGQPSRRSEIELSNVLAYEWQSLAELLVDTGPGTFTVTGLALPWQHLILIGAGILILGILIGVRMSRRRSLRPTADGGPS